MGAPALVAYRLPRRGAGPRIHGVREPAADHYGEVVILPGPRREHQLPDEPVPELLRRDEIPGVGPHVEPRTPQDEAVVPEAVGSDHGVHGERREGDGAAGDGVVQRNTQVRAPGKPASRFRALMSAGSERTEKPPRRASSSSLGWRRIHCCGSAATAAFSAEQADRSSGRHSMAARSAMQRTMSAGRSAMLMLTAIAREGLDDAFAVCTYRDVRGSSKRRLP